jgi:outer membrane protein
MSKQHLLLLGLTAAFSGQAQTGDKWDLRRCVDYAVKNNISVQQADVQARIAALQADARKLAFYPNANFSSNLGMSFGRSIDPTSNQFITSQFVQNSYNLSTGVQVFGWGSLKNSYAAAKFGAEAAKADIERAGNDVSLNVATFYLQVLATKQQYEIAKVQAEQTKSQLDFTKLRVQVGALPELNAAELEAQLARDSVTVVNADANHQQAILQLKALLNLDMAAPFDLDIPPVERIPIESLAELEPANLYKLALTTQPQQRVNNLRFKAAESNLKVAKAAMYPTISVGGGLSTNFANPSQTVTGVNVIGVKPTAQFVNVGGTNYIVQTPDVQLISGKRSFWQMWDGWGTQLDRNFGQNIGIRISVPIFNNGNARLGYERSKLDMKLQETVIRQADLTLQQNIYQAYNTAIAALQRFNAGKKSVETAQKSYEFARKRYETGLATTLDLITNQNNLLRAKLDLLNSQFDYVFRMKLLEFYKGQGLKL